jgi:hypothetical protein
MGDPKLELLTAHNSVLLLVDYQPTMFKGVGSGDRNGIANSAIAAAKAAKILNVPTVLTSIWPEGNGEFIKDITDLFPGQEVILGKLVYAEPAHGADALRAPNSVVTRLFVVPVNVVPSECPCAFWPTSGNSRLSLTSFRAVIYTPSRWLEGNIGASMLIQPAQKKRKLLSLNA